MYFQSRVENSVDPDQMAFVRSQLIWIYSVFKRINLGSAGQELTVHAGSTVFKKDKYSYSQTCVITLTLISELRIKFDNIYGSGMWVLIRSCSFGRCFQQRIRAISCFCCIESIRFLKT